MRIHVMSAALVLLACSAASAQIGRIQVDPAPQVQAQAMELQTFQVQSIRLSCASQDVAALSICSPSGECLTVNQPCFPYHCNPGPKTCATSCSSDDQCWTGTVCHEGRCVVQRSFCDGRYSRNTAGKSTDCWPYACDESAGTCKSRCGVSSDCGEGANCRIELGGQCTTN